MTLKDEYLIEGRVVELKNGLRGLILDNYILFPHGKTNVSEYDDNMVSGCFTYENIDKVFKFIGSFNKYGLETLLCDENLELLWENLDFGQFKLGDLIKVRDTEEDWWVTRRFVKYDGKLIYTLSEDLDEVYSWYMGKKIDG